MPEMDGIALIKAALEIDPHLVPIIMTGQGTNETAAEALEAGTFEYVMKPFRLKILMPILTRAMHVRRLGVSGRSSRNRDAGDIQTGRNDFDYQSR
jgi:DNA-binding NtrC family response regulator